MASPAVHKRVAAVSLGLLAVLSAASGAAAQGPSASDAAALKRMSLEELLNIEVTTASRQPARASDIPSAIQVITGDAIRRSGATNLAEALRLASNLRVAQVKSHAWVVSARGFSGIFTNKLLVMIDGRTVYTPLYGGVLWDVQNPMLEDIDRIEVVSGPGGTMWGSNAVNGVINVITKHAADTRGLYASAAGGSHLNHGGAVRYGGAAGANLFVRAYAERSDRGPQLEASGKDSTDAWDITQAGFRMDWRRSAADEITIQGDAYSGTEKSVPAHSTMDGQNVLGAWTRTFSTASDLKLQVYVDRTKRRDTPSFINDELITTNVDFQHRFAAASRHNLVWGLGYRLMDDETPPTSSFVGIVPRERTMTLFSAFVQDELTLAPDRAKLFVGSKLERNTFSGLEVQPSMRFTWTPAARHAVWSAVSRAVRSPSRFDVDYHIPAMVIPVGTPGVNGGPEFVSEKVVAYEAGYNLQPASTLSLSLATFYNDYDDLYSVESVNGTLTYQIENGTTGWSSGVEMSGTFQPADWWQLRGGYTYFHKKLGPKPGHVFDPSSLGNDPAHQVVLQSILDLPGGLQLDVVPRIVSELPNPAIPAYKTFDVRAAWRFRELEFSIVGQHLGDARHPEFAVQQVRRSVYARVAVRR